MTINQYQKYTLLDMKKRRWRLIRDITTGMMAIPAGTEVKVTGKANGFGSVLLLRCLFLFGTVLPCVA
jgi:hypothetical protein